MLLWLGQNRAEKAVDDLFDGMTLGSTSIRATKTSSSLSGSTSITSNGPSSSPSDSTSCPTPLKIKKEEDGSASPTRSHLSSSHYSGSLPNPVTNGSLAGSQPLARKRTAYQAALGGTINSTVSAGNSAVSGLLSESSPEVSSSQNCNGISPVPSLESSELDLELWDLDIHESSTSNSSGSGIFCILISPRNIFGSLDPELRDWRIVCIFILFRTVLSF